MICILDQSQHQPVGILELIGLFASKSQKKQSQVSLAHTPIHKQHNHHVSSLQQELHADIQSHYLPEMLGTMLRTLCSHIDAVCLEDVTQGLRACFKVLSKIQMPVAYMDVEAGAQAEETELQSLKEECAETQVWHPRCVSLKITPCEV